MILINHKIYFIIRIFKFSIDRYILIFQIEEDNPDGAKIWLTGLITFLNRMVSQIQLRICVFELSKEAAVCWWVWYIKLCCKFEIVGLLAYYFRMDGKSQSLFFYFYLPWYSIFRIEIFRDWHFNKIGIIFLFRRAKGI